MRAQPRKGWAIALTKTEEASWTPQGWKEARRAEKEPRRGDLSPEGAGAAAERLVLNKIQTYNWKGLALKLPK